MNNDALAHLIDRLVKIEPNSSPVISCFVGFGADASYEVEKIHAQARLLRRRLGGMVRHDFEDAYEEIRNSLLAALASPAIKDLRSMALYSRWGDDPCLYVEGFKVPMKTRLHVGPLPQIYPLVTLKDRYDRFITVLLTEDESRIVETSLGSITRDILASVPETAARKIGESLTREIYHRQGQAEARATDGYLQDKILTLDKVVEEGGSTHILLAGNPALTGALQKALPPRLSSLVVSSFCADWEWGLDSVLEEAMAQFTCFEARETIDRLAELEASVLSGGLAVVGYDACTDAIRAGICDVFLIDQELPWKDTREEMVRLARDHQVSIETVPSGPRIDRLGGMGCLLRRHPQPYGVNSALAA